MSLHAAEKINKCGNRLPHTKLLEENMEWEFRTNVLRTDKRLRKNNDIKLL